jgi:hypothetical protein
MALGNLGGYCFTIGSGIQSRRGGALRSLITRIGQNCQQLPSLSHYQGSWPLLVRDERRYGGKCDLPSRTFHGRVEGIAKKRCPGAGVILMRPAQSGAGGARGSHGHTVDA